MTDKFSAMRIQRIERWLKYHGVLPPDEREPEKEPEPKPKHVPEPKPRPNTEIRWRFVKMYERFLDAAMELSNFWQELSQTDDWPTWDKYPFHLSFDELLFPMIDYRDQLREWAGEKPKES